VVLSRAQPRTACYRHILIFDRDFLPLENEPPEKHRKQNRKTASTLLGKRTHSPDPGSGGFLKGFHAGPLSSGPFRGPRLYGPGSLAYFGGRVASLGFLNPSSLLAPRFIPIGGVVLFLSTVPIVPHPFLCCFSLGGFSPGLLDFPSTGRPPNRPFGAFLPGYHAMELPIQPQRLLGHPNTPLY